MNQSVPLDDLLSHREWVRRLAHALVHDSATADDLVQDAWVAALRAPPTDPGAVRSWFRRVLVRLAMNRRRGEDRRREREQAPRRVSSTESPLGAVARLEEHRRLVDIVLSLPSPARETLVLHFFEDRSPKEIGERMSVPASTVRSRLQRALIAVRERLDAEHGGNGRKWRLALVPLLRPQRETAPVRTDSAAAAAVVAGVLLMKWKTVTAAAVLLLLAAFAWRASETAPVDAPPASRAPAPSTAREDTRDARERRRIETSAEASTNAAQSSTAEDGERPVATSVAAISYRLDVHVVGPDGLPVARAKVTFFDQFDGIEDHLEVEEGLPPGAKPRPAPIRDTNAGSMLHTDATGTARARHTLPNARIYVEASGAAGKSDPLTLSAEHTTEVTVRLESALEVRGRLLDANGDAVTGDVVLESETTFGLQPIRVDRADDDGRFEIQGIARPLLSPRVRLRVHGHGFLPQIHEMESDAAVSREHRFVLVPGHRVHGRFVDTEGSPIEDVRILSGTPSGISLSAADGTFERRDLPLSGGTLRATSHEFADRNIDVPESEGDAVDLGDIVLRPDGAITGVVLRTDGTPYAGGSVWLIESGPIQSIPRSALVGADGTFSLSGVGEDAYRVVAIVTDGRRKSRRSRYVEHRGARAGDTLELRATDAHSALVRLVDRSTGERLAANLCCVTITRIADPDDTRQQNFGAVSESGLRVTFPDAGRYRLSIAVTGYDDATVDDLEALADREVTLRVELTPRDK